MCLPAAVDITTNAFDRSTRMNISGYGPASRLRSRIDIGRCVCRHDRLAVGVLPERHHQLLLIPRRILGPTARRGKRRVLEAAR